MGNLNCNEKAKDRIMAMKDHPGAYTKSGKLPKAVGLNTEQSPSAVTSKAKVDFGPPPEKR